jgi:glycosyltransferase involved in cell wall biosynthesis/ribosomal protein S18 acetylase RimI-like enzyme
VSTPPRLVHVTTTDISLALLLGPQLRAFADAGFEVIGMSAPGEFSAELERAGIRHVPLHNATRSFAPGPDARALFELRSRFRELRPDIVHTHNPKPGIYGRLAARAAGVPAVVNTVHGLYALPDDRLAKRAVVYGLERIAATCSDAELVQSVEDVATLRSIGIPARKLHHLGNGIDLARFDPDDVDPELAAELRHKLGVGPDDVVCGVVGRLVREKGYAEVFAAAAALRAGVPDLRFVVVGPTDPAKADALTEEEIDAARAAGVLFLGFRDDVHDLYAAMDLYVLASYREGFPRSAMEAAAMGLPVVATDIRGCREVVEHETTGVLVPPRDAGALATAVERLATDGALRRQMGAAARAKARRDFDQQRVIDLTLQIYDELLPAAKRPRRAGLELRPATAADARDLAAMHVDRIGEGFLSSLGPRFLRHLYRRIVRSPHSFALVAVDEEGVAGFVAAAVDVGGLYKSFVLHDGAAAGLGSAPQLLRSAGKVLETLRYPASTDEDLPAAEILAVGVAARTVRQGVGRALVDRALDEFRRRGVHAVKVVAGADNESALALYQRCAFVPHRRIAVHAGTPSEVLVWRSS